MGYTEAEREVRQRSAFGQPLEDVEVFIRALRLGVQETNVLLLLAWSELPWAIRAAIACEVVGIADEPEMA